jgi:hypothetical protein
MWRVTNGFNFLLLGKLSIFIFSQLRQYEDIYRLIYRVSQSFYREDMALGDVCFVLDADVPRRFQITTLERARRPMLGQFETSCDCGFRRG